MVLNDFFDHIYVLNLPRSEDRRRSIKHNLPFEYEFFRGVDGSVVRNLWEKQDNHHFKNPNYLACTLSHLLIYRDALDRGYGNILILEDDVLPHMGLVENPAILVDLPEYKNLLYLGYIPLSPDCSRWDYNRAWTLHNRIGDQGFFKANNLWGLFAYSPTTCLMEKTLGEYEREFPMELDRWFVDEVQPMGDSIGLSPQMFCHGDGFTSLNMDVTVGGMVQRSVDVRFAKYNDYGK